MGLTDLDTFKNWVTFGLLEAQNVETSDDKRIAALDIIKRCEDRDREAIEETADRGFLGLG